MDNLNDMLIEITT